jgi:hypothetical protein
MASTTGAAERITKFMFNYKEIRSDGEIQSPPYPKSDFSFPGLKRDIFFSGHNATSFDEAGIFTNNKNVNYMRYEIYFWN